MQGVNICTAFMNIDLNAVGNWAERNNIAYSSYQELSQHPQVLGQIEAHVSEVNTSVASDPMLAGCQIHRFLVLHKELDADDGEMTRTRKVRRAVIADKFSDLMPHFIAMRPTFIPKRKSHMRMVARARLQRRWICAMLWLQPSRWQHDG